MGKVLQFNFRGNEYQVNELGWLRTTNVEFSPSWIFLGCSRNIQTNEIQYTLEDAFKYPELLIGCTVWDKDKGKIRQWNCQCGRNPARIQHAMVEQ